jgi:hypothetical protein
VSRIADLQRVNDDLDRAIQEFEDKCSRAGYYMPAIATRLRIYADEMADKYPDEINGGAEPGVDKMVAERAEAAVERAVRLALEKAAAAVVGAQSERCRSCGHPRDEHPYRHPFVGVVADAPATIRTLDPAAIAAEAMKEGE